ncbi:hypothetical protein GHK62_11525 [Sinorhizobium terangae]|uniref:DUF2946 domain-containing protein n=1 Tax=Sinorhizobium terangae TaxID=110322 RepID=A0A6N7LDS7_SINTE|nr:hypothetical protein [Sinorhizobium terangae]
MARRHAPRQIATFLLAVFLAVGMGASFAEASSMAARMATMSNMIMSDMVENGDCQGCPDQPDDSGMKAMACGNVCAAPIIAPLPLAAVVPDGETPISVVAPDLALDGQTPPPDPAPPRTTDIG